MKTTEQKQENLLDKMGISFHRTLTFKLFVIGALTLFLLIPKFMILTLMKERSQYSKHAVTDVMSKWSQNQTISGPALVLPVRQLQDNIHPEEKAEIGSLVLLPESLNVNAKINPKKLNRNIYDVIVYESELVLTGSFNWPKPYDLNIDAENIMWQNAELQLGINDLRGISEQVFLQWNNTERPFNPGLKSSAIGNTGISVHVEPWPKGEKGEFEIRMKLKGSKNLMFSPVGEQTTVHMESSWNDPGFTGSFLPVERNIADSGFTADWKVLHFNRNFPQFWMNQPESTVCHSDISSSNFGVELVSMADHYQKNTRSAKYGILIIAVVFVVFFMIEVFSGQRIHPVQYILVGGSIVIFYLLLLAFSEHVGFDLAYFISTLAVVILVFFYTFSFMPKRIQSLGTGAILATCFGFIFILLQLETYALLTGSLALFVLLALLMYFTKKIN